MHECFEKYIENILCCNSLFELIFEFIICIFHLNSFLNLLFVFLFELIFCTLRFYPQLLYYSPHPWAVPQCKNPWEFVVNKTSTKSKNKTKKSTTKQFVFSFPPLIQHRQPGENLAITLK